MSNSLVIAQITDMHIGESDIESQQQFLKVLQVLQEKPLDLLVLSGDLVAVEGKPEGYTWLKQALTTFPYPYVVMAGNHDRVMPMQKIFDLPVGDVSEDMLFFSRTIQGKRLLFLDSSSDSIATSQLEWLGTQLTCDTEPVLLFIHHPPAQCGCVFMDEHHALRNIDAVWQVLDKFPQVQHIFCGHYHTEKTIVKNGRFIHLTPATIFQIETYNHDFAIEHSRPGWRIIEWKKQTNKIQTYVEYIKTG